MKRIGALLACGRDAVLGSIRDMKRLSGLLVLTTACALAASPAEVA